MIHYRMQIIVLFIVPLLLVTMKLKLIVNKVIKHFLEVYTNIFYALFIFVRYAEVCVAWIEDKFTCRSDFWYIARVTVYALLS